MMESWSLRTSESSNMKGENENLPLADTQNLQFQPSELGSVPKLHYFHQFESSLRIACPCRCHHHSKIQRVFLLDTKCVHEIHQLLFGSFR